MNNNNKYDKKNDGLLRFIFIYLSVYLLYLSLSTYVILTTQLAWPYPCTYSCLAINMWHGSI